MATFSVSDMVVGEGDGFVDIVVKLTGQISGSASVNYATAAGTAGSTDYTDASGVLNFATGDSTQTVRVNLTNDKFAEALEHFRFNLSSATNGSVLTPSAMVSIVDNDTLVAKPNLTVRDVIVDEKAGTATFVVLLGGPRGQASANQVTVDYATADLTATAGSDYIGTGGRLTFAPGETVKNVVVNIVDDTQPEGIERFALNLSNVVGATLTDAQGIAEIAANDNASASMAHVTVADVAVSEGYGYVDMAVRLTTPSTGSVYISYATAPGTAAAGFDYTNVSGNLVFLPGETVKVVRIEMIDETQIVENTETFRFNLTSADGAIIDKPLTVVTIIDDDGPAPSGGTLFVGTTGPDLLIASDGNDSLQGLGGDDQLFGRGGNDSLNGGPGSDYLDGGDGIDTASYKDASGPVNVDLSTGKSSGADGSDTFVSIENIEGSGFADTLTGNTESNVIDGGAGADKMAGGRGADIYYVDNAGDVVTELDNVETNSGSGLNQPLDLGSAIDKVIASVNYTLTNFVENLDIGAGSTGLSGTGNELDNILTGNPGANALNGMAGNDRLIGGAGNDALDGGTGNDTAVYSGPLQNYRIEKVGTGWKLTDDTGADGVDTLKGIETLEFAGKTLQLANLPPSSPPGYGLNNAFLFDSVFYLINHSELVPAQSLATAAQHYFNSGAAAGYQPNVYFDANYYKTKWADLTPLNLDNSTLFKHFNLFGVWEGRSPGPAFDKFDGTQYLAANPDVAAYVDANVAAFLGSRVNGAIAHFIIYGANEGRAAVDLVGQPIKLDYGVDFLAI